MDVLNLESPEYPDSLRDLSDPPKTLYIKGNYDKTYFDNCLSVVGSRKISSYGIRVTRNFVGDVAAKGITVVSGFMYGVDSEAHKAALSVGGRTVAVMGCGIDIVCPSFQKSLYDQILKSGGLIISEYPEDTPPRKWTFVRRNRIVAAISRALLVVEAGDSSGSLITASYARKLGRKVFAVPGNVFSPGSKGIYQLIAKGANIAYSSSCIRKFYFGNHSSSDLFSSGTLVATSALGPNMTKILELLKKEPLNVNQIIRRTSLPASQVISAVASLTLDGVIVEEGSTYYAN